MQIECCWISCYDNCKIVPSLFWVNLQASACTDGRCAYLREVMREGCLCADPAAPGCCCEKVYDESEECCLLEASVHMILGMVLDEHTDRPSACLGTMMFGSQCIWLLLKAQTTSVVSKGYVEMPAMA